MQRCVGVVKEKVFDISMMMIRQRNTRKIIPPRENLSHRAIEITIMVKIKRKEEERRAIKIAFSNTESTNVEEKIRILETEEKKIDRMMIMRRISTTASEEVEEKEKNDGTRTVIRGETTARTDWKEEARETKIATEEEIRSKREWKGEIKETSTEIGSVGIVITRGKDPWRTRMIRDTGTDRTSIKKNDESKKERTEKASNVR